MSRDTPTVYLAGPISGLDYDTAQRWRDQATRTLMAAGIIAFSPLRGKEVMRAVGPISGHGREYSQLTPLGTPHAIIARDHFDATTCDLVLVNMIGATRVSIGTVWELGAAYTKGVPIVLVMEPEDLYHDHMFVTETASFRAASLEGGLDLTIAILEPPARKLKLEAALEAELLRKQIADGQRLLLNQQNGHGVRIDTHELPV